LTANIAVNVTSADPSVPPIDVDGKPASPPSAVDVRYGVGAGVIVTDGCTGVAVADGVGVGVALGAGVSVASGVGVASPSSGVAVGLACSSVFLSSSEEELDDFWPPNRLVRRSLDTEPPNSASSDAVTTPAAMKKARAPVTSAIFSRGRGVLECLRRP
jgi:hypothetical protein